MNLDEEEKQVRKILSSYKLKEPPAGMMEGYVEEVRRKIKTSPAGLPLGPASLLAWTLAGAVLLGVLVFAFPRLGVQPKPIRSLSSTAQEAEPAPVTPPSEEALHDRLAEDLFILEMLGEDEGVFSDFEHVETDLELL